MIDDSPPEHSGDTLVDIEPAAKTAPGRPLRAGRLQLWPGFVALGLMLAGLAIFLAAIIPVPWFARSPGDVVAVTDFVAADSETFDAVGSFYFLTVASSQVTALGWLESVLDDEVDLERKEVILPDGQTQEQRKRAGLNAQEESKQRAIFVALSELGFDVTFTGEGAILLEVVEGTPADEALQNQDVIIAVDGGEVGLAEDLVATLGERAPGDTVTLTVERLLPGSSTEVEEVEVAVTLATHPDDPTRPFLGVSLGDFRAVAVFPIEVEIDSQNIGGPSAGLMYTLGIMNLLTEEDMTKGHRIAGTGTIRLDGSVGAIGGVRQKVFAARRAAAEYVIVPAANYEDALTAQGDGVEIIPVQTIDDALLFLDQLQPASPEDRFAG